MKFGDNLKAIRKHHKMSQEQLAEKVHVSRQSVSKWENGEAYPEMNNILQLCKIFNCKINDLVHTEMSDFSSLDEEIVMNVVKFNEKKQKQVKTLSNVIGLIGKIGGIVLKVAIAFIILAMVLVPYVVNNVEVGPDEITFKTEGGHSFGAFGNRSAVYAMSDLICNLYNCEIPVEEGSKTTFNVGIVEGGTSVNTIPQSAKMLYEYRSSSARCLAIMKEFFETTVKKAKEKGLAEIEVTLVGDRPCSSEIDEKHFAEMEEKVVRITEKHTGKECKPHPSSTDCNIPMSLGIPGLAVGNCTGIGAHTREEKLLISSVPIGLKVTAELMLSFFEA